MYLLRTLLLLTATLASAQIRVIAFGAHPDDCDLGAGGLAAKLSKMGHKVKFVSLTNGDAGHQSMGGGALAKRRRAEATESGRRLGIEYEVLDNHDGELLPTLDVRLQVIRRIRQWNADVVISPRTNDYHPDHRNTGQVVQDAAYMVMVPNVAPDTPPIKKNPVFLHFQDRFQKPQPFRADIAIDIGDVFETKINALDAHESQFYEWLPWIGGEADKVPAGKAERKAWLAGQRTRSITPTVKAALEKFYGKDAAAKIQYTEAFEISELGTQPNEEMLRKLFPMVPAK
jgi:LmbE family N-acetylglucosaminyl deacetylase